MGKNILFTKVTYFLIIIIIAIAIYNMNKNTKTQLMEGTIYETPIHYFNNNEKIDVLIIAGIHGNEIAGIMAADDIIMEEYKWANFTIIPRANIEAANQNVRHPYYMTDLNRSFPGKDTGSYTEQLANEIYDFVKHTKPDIILDLHEWKRKYDEDDSLNSSGIIFSSGNIDFLKSIEKVYNDYRFNNPDNMVMLEFGGITGTINKEVSTGLGIPVVTIESNMNYDINDRVEFQLEIIESITRYYVPDS